MSTAAPATSNPLARIFGSTIGLKVLMALTGLLWVGFVLGHMVGNLQIFLPVPTDGSLHPIDKYGAMLKSTGGLLWAVRLGLLATFATHVWSAITLNGRNKAARPVAYGQQQRIQARPTSYYMTISGLVILAFVLFHLAHFTLGVVQPEAFGDVAGHPGVHDIRRMFVLGFRNPAFAGIYIVSNVLLGLHLHHAVSSMFQTLGLRTPKYRPWVDKLGPAIAALVIAGNVLMPLSVMLGLIGGDIS